MLENAHTPPPPSRAPLFLARTHLFLSSFLCILLYVCPLTMYLFLSFILYMCCVYFYFIYSFVHVIQYMHWTLGRKRV